MRPIHLLGLLSLAIAWGTAYMFMRASVPAFGAVPMIFLRMALASLLVLWPLLLWRQGLAGFRSFRLHWRQMALVGLVFTGLPFLALGFSAKFISAGMMAILQAGAPMSAALVGHLWLKERLSRSRAIGLAIGLAGVLLLVGDKAALRDGAWIGIVLTLAATILWGVSSNYTRARQSHVDPLALAAGGIGFAALLTAPLAWLTWPATPPDLRAWLEILFLGVVSSGLGFFLYFTLLQKVGAMRTVSVTFLNPVVAMASAALYIDEPVTGRMLAGCAVILFGTALSLGLIRLPGRGPANGQLPQGPLPQGQKPHGQ